MGGSPGARETELLAPDKLVEAVQNGWWYSAPLPGGRVAAAFFTDAGLFPPPLGVPLWRRCLEEARARGLFVLDSRTTARTVLASEAGRVSTHNGFDWEEIRRAREDAVRTRLAERLPLAGTTLGMAPGILVITLLGNQLGTVLSDPEPGDIALFALFVLGWLAVSLGLQWLATKLRARNDG